MAGLSNTWATSPTSLTVWIFFPSLTLVPEHPRYGPMVLLREVALILLALVFCLPFYVLVTMSLETSGSLAMALGPLGALRA